MRRVMNISGMKINDFVEDLYDKFANSTDVSMKESMQEAYNAGDAAGYKRGLEDAAKEALNCNCDHLATHASMRNKIAAAIRALAEGKEG